MPKCINTKRRHRKPCIGDMDTIIKLQNRSITEPLFGSPDFDETFDGDNNVWGMLQTVSGKTIFDDVGKDVNVTHEIIINYDNSVTDETWVELNGRRLDILLFEDIEERHEFLKLTCTDRGKISFEATKA